MRRFVVKVKNILRDIPIIEGVLFSNGKVAVCWLGEHSSTVAWNSFEDFVAISVDGHNMRFVKWLDE